MQPKYIILKILLFIAFQCPKMEAQVKSIYHEGWIDFNKNGKMDVFEDPTQPI